MLKLGFFLKLLVFVHPEGFVGLESIIKDHVVHDLADSNGAAETWGHNLED